MIQVKLAQLLFAKDNLEKFCKLQFNATDRLNLVRILIKHQAELSVYEKARQDYIMREGVFEEEKKGFFIPENDSQKIKDFALFNQELLSTDVILEFPKIKYSEIEALNKDFDIALIAALSWLIEL